MGDKGIVAVVIGAVAIGLLFIFSKQQSVNNAVALGTKQIVPQASQNYAGYLAASTAPAVTSALSGFLTGLGNLSTSWFHGSTPVGQSPSSAAPQGAQQQVSGGVGPNLPAPISAYAPAPQTQITDLSYDGNTTGSAFNYGGLSSDNSFDPLYSLDPSSVDVYAS
jgi:hypothetical protein